jgi:hypothetical protein
MTFVVKTFKQFCREMDRHWQRQSFLDRARGRTHLWYGGYIGPERQLPMWAGSACRVPPRKLGEQLKLEPRIYAATVQFDLGDTLVGPRPEYGKPVLETHLEPLRQRIEKAHDAWLGRLLADAFARDYDQLKLIPMPDPGRWTQLANQLRYYRRRFAYALHRLGTCIDPDSLTECDHGW